MDRTVNTTEISAPPNLISRLRQRGHALVWWPAPAPSCPIRLEAWTSHLRHLRLAIAKEVGTMIEAAWRDHLVQEGVTHAFIALEDLEIFQDYLSRHTHVFLGKDSKDPPRGAQPGPQVGLVAPLSSRPCSTRATAAA